jgi:hypothetical protein
MSVHVLATPARLSHVLRQSGEQTDLLLGFLDARQLVHFGHETQPQGVGVFLGKKKEMTRIDDS